LLYIACLGFQANMIKAHLFWDLHKRFHRLQSSISLFLDILCRINTCHHRLLVWAEHKLQVDLEDIYSNIYDKLKVPTS